VQGEGVLPGDGAVAVSDKVTFLAAFPCIQSAIKITGAGDGMRIQLDVPESEMVNAIELLAWRQRVLKVTVELQNEETGTISRRKAKRRITESDTSL
jgi:hypothetical protein